MRKDALVGALCAVALMLLAVLALPRAGAPGAGWGTPELIESDSTHEAGYPQVAIDAAGNAIAVWLQSDGVITGVWANRYVAGAGWGVAGRIESGSGNASYPNNGASRPQVAVDPAGNAFAVWEQSDGAHYNIYSNRYVVGAGWGTATLVEANDAGNATDEKVAVDPAGNAIAVWMQTDGTWDNIWANRYVVGAGWGAPELFEEDPGYASYPEIGMDAAGNAIAVWHQNNATPGLHIYASRYAVGVGWDAPTLLVDPATHASYDEQVAVAPDGTAIAIWSQSDPSFTATSIYATRFVPGAGWGTPELLETNPMEALGPYVAVDPAGNAIAVWTQMTPPGNYQTWANRYVPGAGWGTAEALDPTERSGGPSAVGIDSGGNATVVWTHWDGGQNHVILADRYVAGVGWGAPAPVSTSTGFASEPDVAVDPQGDAIAVWHCCESNMVWRPDIWANVYGAPGPSVPVADAGLDQTVSVGTTVAFDGSGSTDDVGIVNYTWTFSDGGARALYGMAPTYTFGNVGVFVVTLEVRDGAGNTDTDVVVITVTPLDMRPPHADAGPDWSILAGTALTLDGTGSTDDVGIVNYTWGFTDGSARTRYTATFLYRFDNVGTIQVNLTVRDAAGNSDSDIAVITVTPPDMEGPVAEAGPDRTVQTDATVILDGRNSTDDVGIVNYTWTFTYNGTAITLYGDIVAFPFAARGGYTVTLTVRDAAGNSDSDTAVITSIVGPSGGGTVQIAVLPVEIVVVALLAVLVVASLVLYILARKRKRGADSKP